MNLLKRHYNYTYWLKKAKEYGIPTEGREEQARKVSEGVQEEASRWLTGGLSCIDA